MKVKSKKGITMEELAIIVAVVIIIITIIVVMLLRAIPMLIRTEENKIMNTTRNMLEDTLGIDTIR